MNNREKRPNLRIATLHCAIVKAPIRRRLQVNGGQEALARLASVGNFASLTRHRWNHSLSQRLQRDDVRFVVGDSLRVSRSENDEFRIEEDQEFTFINSGNRQAVITEIYGTLVLVTDSNAQRDNRLAKNIFLNANKIVLKPGEIQLLRAKVVKDYPWEKGKDGLYFRETKMPSQKYIVCIEFYVTTPDSSSVRLVQPLYELAPGESPIELFNKDEPIKVMQRTRWGLD